MASSSSRKSSLARFLTTAPDESWTVASSATTFTSLTLGVGAGVAKADNLLGIVSVARPNYQGLLRGSECQLAILSIRVGTVRRIPDAVLVAQVLFDSRVDLVDGVIGGDFEVFAASLARQPLHGSRAVRGWAARVSVPADASERPVPTMGEQNRIDRRVRALCIFDGVGKGGSAQHILAIRKQNEGLARSAFA